MSGWLAIATANLPTSWDRNSSQHWCSSSSMTVGSSWFVIGQASGSWSVRSTAEGPDSRWPTVDPMRYAFATSPQRTTWDWLLEVWRIADELPAYESGWTFDHLYPIMGDPTEDCLEGWITLTALLHETVRLRGGVLVTGMVYRHPGVLASMASTLDITSGGRLELGIGAGWNEEECDAFGIDLGTMQERFDRFEEGLAVLTSLLSNERTTFDGAYYELNEAMNNPKPLQSPLPICIGGTGKKRTLPLAARYA